MEQYIAPDSQALTRLIPFEFKGNAVDYFGIWFANGLLNMVTLGIYSPWAKVRNLRYLYGNTFLDDKSFDFHANPVDILKGRLIAVGALVIYSVLSTLNPLLEVVFFLMLVPLIPWIIVRGMKFRYQNTSYSNIRFGFNGTYWYTALEYVLFPLLAVMTLGLLLPYVRFRQKRFLINHTRFGTTQFSFHGEPVAWYKVTGIGIAIMAAGAMLTVGAMLAIEILEQTGLPNTGLYVTLAIVLGVLISLIGWDYYFAHTRNLIFNNGKLSAHAFASHMRALPLFRLSLVNAIVVVVSFGLMSPWAPVRLMRYQADTLSLVCAGALGTFLADQQQAQAKALGDELGDAFDVEFGL